MLVWFITYVLIGLAEEWLSSRVNVPPWQLRLAMGVAAGLVLGARGVAITVLGELVFVALAGTRVPLIETVLGSLLNVLHVVLAASLLRGFNFDPGLSRVRDTAALLGVGILFCSLMTSFARYLLDMRLGVGPTVWWQFTFGVATPAIVVIPVLLLLAAGRLQTWLATDRGYKLHLLLVLLLVLPVTWFSYDWLPRHISGLDSYQFLIILPIAWAALRLGMFETACVALATDLFVHLSVVAAGLMVADPFSPDYVSLQAFLGIVFAAGLLLATANEVERKARSKLEVALAELHDRELVYYSVVGVTSDAIFDINLKANTLACSEAAYDLFRVPKEKLVDAMPWWHSHMEPIEEVRVEASLRAALHSNASLWVEEYWLRRDDDRPVYVSVRARILRGASGKPYRVIGAVSDLTELRQRSAEIERLNADLERRVVERTTELARANQELEAFSYSVSHDLRAPLRAIDGFNRIVIEEYSQQLGEQGRAYLERACTASHHMAELIDDLLALSHVSRSTLNLTQVDLSELAEQIIAELRHLEPQRQVAVTIEPGLWVQGDAGLLRIMLNNLLGNAWKFTAKQSAPTIYFGRTDNGNAAAGAGSTTFVVRDNGAGFDMRFADKLFDAFQRLHTESEYPGTGVGLATVQRVVQRHQGRVWAESELGKGTGFYFTLSSMPYGGAAHS